MFFFSAWDTCLCNKVPFLYLLNGCCQSICKETNIQICAAVSENKNHLGSKILRVIYVVPSRVSCEIRPGCSVFCPAGSWKHIRMETEQHPPTPGNLCPCLNVLRLKKFLLIPCLNFPCFSSCLLSFILPSWTTVKSRVPRSPEFPHRKLLSLVKLPGCTAGSCSLCCPLQHPRLFLHNCFLGTQYPTCPIAVA